MFQKGKARNEGFKIHWRRYVCSLLDQEVCCNQSQATARRQAETTLQGINRLGQVARYVEKLGTLLQVQGSDHIGSVSKGPQETVWVTGKLMLKDEHKDGVRVSAAVAARTRS